MNPCSSIPSPEGDSQPLEELTRRLWGRDPKALAYEAAYAGDGVHSGVAQPSKSFDGKREKGNASQAPTSHRSIVAALSLHYRRAIECLLRLPVYACVSGLQMAKQMVKHYPRQSYDFASSRGQLHQVDPYY